MIIVIDGYNLLKKIFPHVQGKLDRHKIMLARQLALYKQCKAHEISEILLVFDGGYFGHASREVKGGVVIMHAGQKSSADEWIVAFSKRNKGKQLLLISLDRELIRLCKEYAVVSMPVDDFYDTMQRFLMQANQTAKSEHKQLDTQVHRYHSDEVVESLEGYSEVILDNLMQGASMQTPDKDEQVEVITSRDKAGNKSSKKMRTINHIIKKLT